MILAFILPGQTVAAPGEQSPTINTAVAHMLSMRDGSPSCADVESHTADPVPELLAIVEGVPLPPWVGMRAAKCLIDNHGIEIEPQLRAWVVDPKKRGLGSLTLNRIDQLPMSLAIDLATLAATQGPAPQDAQRRIARSNRPEIRRIGGVQ